MFVLQLTQDSNREMSNYIDKILRKSNHTDDAIRLLKNKIEQSEGTRYRTYIRINPTLDFHDVYKRKLFVPEHHRMYFTRMRLSSHRLKIETGRWSRLPRERRLCVCGAVQDEEHVLCHCPRTEHLRDSYAGRVEFSQLFKNAMNIVISN